MAVIEVGEADFEARVVEASRQTPVVVDFWAGWCRPCLVLGPILERLAGERDGKLALAKVDVDANPGLAARFGIQGIPAVKAFRDGQVVSEFVGAQPEELVRRFLDDLAPSEADDQVQEADRARAEGHVAEEEAAYRRALELRPGHEDATVGLARLLAGDGRAEEARGLLEAVPGSEEGRAALAELELMELAGSSGGLGAAARAAAAGEHRMALERALELLADGEDRDAARALMVRVFDVLGPDHPLTREYRPRLARALY